MSTYSKEFRFVVKGCPKYRNCILPKKFRCDDPIESLDCVEFLVKKSSHSRTAIMESILKEIISHKSNNEVDS